MATRGSAGELVRDPVSELWDGPAARLLERAYARQGMWAETRLANPGPRQLAWAASEGINLLGPDPVQTISGRHIDARSVWVRGFIRAVYYQHRWYYRQGHGLTPARRVTPNRSLAIRFRVGRLMPVRGVVPAGRLVAIMAVPGGQAALRAVRALPDDRRIFADDGSQAGASIDPDSLTDM